MKRKILYAGLLLFGIQSGLFAQQGGTPPSTQAEIPFNVPNLGHDTLINQRTTDCDIAVRCEEGEMELVLVISEPVLDELEDYELDDEGNVMFEVVKKIYINYESEHLGIPAGTKAELYDTVPDVFDVGTSGVWWYV